jgi:hypothetical protein
MSFCPELKATYLDIVNRTWFFQLSRDQQLQAFELAKSDGGQTALLRIETVVNDIYNAKLEHEPIQCVRDSLLHQKVGTDTLIAALEIMPTVWDTRTSSDATLVALCQLYIDICLKKTSPGVRSVCLLNLSAVLNNACATGKFSMMPYQNLLQLWATLPMGSMNPNLADSVIKVSGSVMAVVGRCDPGNASITNWGVLMADTGSYEQVSGHTYMHVYLEKQTSIGLCDRIEWRTQKC